MDNNDKMIRALVNIVITVTSVLHLAYVIILFNLLCLKIYHIFTQKKRKVTLYD